MKAVIEGKRYDTETATEIAKWWNGMGRGDFGFVVEKLYKTKSGAYFLAGEGGASSSYSQSVGNNARGGGERITPLSREEALAWCEEHRLVNAIESEFADIIKDA